MGKKKRYDSELARTIGNAARQTRRARGYTQEEIAARVDLATGSYSKIERGQMMPSIPSLLAMANSLGVSTDSLLGRTGAPFPPPPAPRVQPESPEIRRLIRRLRKLPARIVRCFNQIALEFERRRKMTRV